MTIWSQKSIFLFLLICAQSVWAYTNLTPSEVHDRLLAGDTVLVLDVREVDEYQAGHMAEPPGNLPLTPVNMALNSGVLDEYFSFLPRDIDIIVYCRSGGRSATASAFLESEGYSRIFNMTTGFSSWTFEYRTGGYGDHTGRWIRSNDPSPVTLLFEYLGDTSKVIFPTSAIPGELDSVYLELHVAPGTAYLLPQLPEADIEDVYRFTVLDRFALPVFTADSIVLSDSVSLYLSISTEADTILNPTMQVYVPGEGWPVVRADFESMIFYHKNSILRKWYYLGAESDPSVVGKFTNQKLPQSYELNQNYPNPFNPSTIINYELPITNDVELSIYNLLGQKVAVLISQKQQAGYYQEEWNATQFSSGVYYYKITAGTFQSVKKMILLR